MTRGETAASAGTPWPSQDQSSVPAGEVVCRSVTDSSSPAGEEVSGSACMESTRSPAGKGSVAGSVSDMAGDDATSAGVSTGSAGVSATCFLRRRVTGVSCVSLSRLRCGSGCGREAATGVGVGFPAGSFMERRGLAAPTVSRAAASCWGVSASPPSSRGSSSAATTVSPAAKRRRRQSGLQAMSETAEWLAPWMAASGWSRSLRHSDTAPS